MTTVTTSVFTKTPAALHYAITHVFFPVVLPRVSDYTPQNDHSLVRAVCAAAHAYSEKIDDDLQPQWHRITDMLENLQTCVQSERLDKDHVISQLGGMKTGDIITFFLRSRNAAVIFRKQESCTLYESFELSPRRKDVEETAGSLVCIYPGPAVEVPNTVIDDGNFRSELANFITHPNKIDSNPPNPAPTPSQHITALLTGILRAVGCIAGISRITKRVRDEIGRVDRINKGNSEWRRSPLWFLIRAAIQTSLDRSTSGRALYKAFMLFFICSLAIDANNAEISNDLLHLMSAKILRRLSKLGTSTPDWLSDMALKTCGCLQDTLEVRWASEQATKSPLSPWNPSQLDLTKDTHLSLLHSHEYLHNALAGPAHKPGRTPFRLKDHVRGTLEDFLSSNGTFFEDAYRSRPYVCLFDVERSVEQGIDDWVARITDVFQACAQLETLMNKYLSTAHHMGRSAYDATPEHSSIMLLTALELWVALDQLVVKEIPILADYSPEVPTVFLERLLLRKSMNFQRLSYAYRYLSSRHSQSHLGWSVLSDEFTEDSFPVRYYECSPDLQHLKAHIEAEEIQAPTICAYRTNIDPDVGYLPGGHLDNDRTGTFKLILPSEPLHAKVVVFELQCPVLVRIWRSATTRLLHHFVSHSIGYWPGYKDDGSFVPLSDIPKLQPYLAEHLRQKLPVKAQFHFAYLYTGGPQSQNGARLCYAFELRFQDKQYYSHGEGFCEWRQNPASGHLNHRHKLSSKQFAYKPYFHFGSKNVTDSRDNMHAYLEDTICTSNKVLSAQMDCPEDYSLHEYIVFGHLRSGGSLQWTNILRELRIRALNIHRDHFHYLLAQAASQIGPLDLTTGRWTWHQELQEPSFCHALLEELESLFVDLAASSSDGMAMNTISFLATRLLASSPCEDVSEQAIRLLQNVRRITFRWVKELSYNLIQDPRNRERRTLVQDMAATCRSTCDVDPTTLHKISLSAEDVEALLACGIFIHATSPTNPALLLSEYSHVVVERDRRLAPVLEVVLRDAILADVSDQAIDLAVGNIWPGYRPGDRRWEPLSDPNSCQLTCQTAETGNGRSQTVHVDLLDGSLLVDGQPLGGLPPEIRDHPVYLQIFKSESFVVIPSSLPGMDFATLGTVSEHYVHFSLRGEDLVIQAQPKDAVDILELIPREKLEGDLPTILVEDHVHWLNISTSTIEIRPLNSLWKYSPENWKVDCVPGEYRMHKDHTLLADPQSQTWEMVSSRLRCLELPGNLIVAASTSGSSSVPQLSVTLPRYGLSFFVNEDEDLESRDFREMVYDKDQCIGALFRLAEQLVLRPKVQVEGLVHRRVLIPHNLLSPNKNPISHPNHSLEPVQYHAYKVDTDLGCLTENACFKSKVYLAGLHELTSIDWRPDPLTGKTGTQEALCLLQSAGCQSWPGWDLGSHSSYNMSPGSVPGHYLHDDSEHPQIDVALLRGLPRTKKHDLGHITQLKRSATRGTYLSPSNINAGGSRSIPLGECTVDRDYVYSDMELEDTVYTAASTVYNRRVNVPITDTLSRWADMWDSALCDTMRAETMTPLSSSSSLSSSPHDLPRVVTIEAQRILRGNETACQRFGPLFLLPTLAYCSPFPRTALLSLRTTFAEQSLRENPACFPPRPQPASFACEAVPPRYTGTFEREPFQITLDQLLHSRTAPELPPRSTDSLLSLSSPIGSLDSSPDISALHRLFTPLRMQTDPPFRQEYISRLRISAQHARNESYVIHEGIENSLIEALKQRFAQCRGKYMHSLDILKEHLGPTAVPLERALDRSGQWPRITADTLLQCLASTSPIKLSSRWKKQLVSLALLLLDLQHARRLLRFALDGLEEEFYKELGNEGCNEWCAEIYPDWLLVQIQGDFRIRSIQAEIAKEIISPQSGENTAMKNTVMQVNMGEGKSSVIVPISAAALADGHQLVRVIVPKALAAQTFDTLVRCLGGLAGRKIYRLPFSRGNGHLPPSDRGNKGYEMDQIYDQMSQCMNDRGILVVQPEHILSLKLASVEKQLSEGKTVAERSLNSQRSIYERAMTFMSVKSLTEGSYVANVFQSFGSSFNRPSQNHITNDDHDGNALRLSGAASKSLELQQWLHSHARDILDESDEILHTRWQLIYTIGIQERVDGYPGRWTIIQQVLRLVRKHMSSLANDVPDAIKYEHGPPGSFPHVRILQGSDAGQLLISSVVEDVMAGRLRSFRFQYTDPTLQLAIRNFISREHPGPEEVKEVQKYVQQSQQSGLLEGLLLLRGLLASNILLFAFIERRWRVDYGLQPTSRTRGLAVPYRAKDVPAHDTQFGHPDVTILFTCLSYYYSGLRKEELKIAFEIMLDQDDPASEFAMWVEDCEPGSVPDSLQRLSDINLQSSEQWDKHLFPLLSRNQGAIDFYLSRVVFPKEAKEFPWKLSGSSWDLAENRECPVTGFSGTADGRYLLPMSISHRNLDHQQGTDARALACLLQPENNFYMLTANENGERRTTQELLGMVVTQTPEIRVLLDVGAQILDLSNYEVAKAWLRLTSDTTGAIYFKDDELMVLTKNGTTLSLISSPLSQQLDRCVAYLDHAHTRGTDIKFPKGFRAAVTLGPKVTKDHLVQGCMRMRKLGHGHSVMFFAPPEVDRNIRFVAAKEDKKIRITTADILHWAIRETWIDIQQRAYHWAQQGMDYRSRYNVWSRTCRHELSPEKMAEAWLQPEHKSLADLYSPCDTRDTSDSLPAMDPDIQSRCIYLGGVNSSFRKVSLDEEQERQVLRQLEREREVELAPEAEPAEHSLHPDVEAFVMTGYLPSSLTGTAFHPVFTTLEKSSAASRETQVWSPFILATEDFCRTIKPESTRGRMDQYLRPVQWVLSGFKGRDRVLVLLSPFEADRLMPAIRTSEHVHLHVYLPRTTEQMKPSDDLKFYVIPPLPDDWTPPWDLIDQLNVFAGQLYLRDYESYLRLSQFLGITPTGTATATRRNLFIPGALEDIENTFVDSPLPCIMTLLNIRRRGLPFMETHMGKILQGRTLTAEDFKKPPTVASGHSLKRVTGGRDVTSHREARRSSKRRLVGASESPDVYSEPPSKRLRVD